MKNRLINKIISYAIRNIKVFFKLDWKSRLDQVELKISSEDKKNSQSKLKVLIGPSFAIWPTSYLIDKSLSIGLESKGIEVVAMYCDGVQHNECNFIGGPWSGVKTFDDLCANCKLTSERLWSQKEKESLHPFSKYLSIKDRNSVDELVTGLELEEALDLERSGIKYGKLAKNTLTNNHLVGDLYLIENYEFLFRSHLKNLLLVSIAYEKILDKENPDRVISNDSFYGIWAILEAHCKSRGIEYYSHWPVTNKRVAFAHNDAAMNLNFLEAWLSFSKIPLTPEENIKIDNWMAGNRALLVDTTGLSGYEEVDLNINKVDRGRPTLLIAANAVWDLSAIDKQIVFEDMMSWILKTIDWFASKKNYQLIIRPHPIETSPGVPKTKETVEFAIRSAGIAIPDNVYLFRSDAKITARDILKKYNIQGVCVHTTTLGLESVALGIPVVTSGKSPYRGCGFTLDPNTDTEYFKCLENILECKKSVSNYEIELARKFINFYQFHYYQDLGLYFDGPLRLSSDYEAIVKDQTGAFGYTIRSIIDGTPIVGKETWPPRS